MVEYKSLAGLIKKSRCTSDYLNLSSGEKIFLRKLEPEMRDYGSAPDAMEEVEEFYENLCDKKYKSAKKLLEDARCLLNHASDEIRYPQLRDNALTLIRMVNPLIKKRENCRESGPHSLAENLHFQQSTKGDFVSFL